MASKAAKVRTNATAAAVAAVHPEAGVVAGVMKDMSVQAPSATARSVQPLLTRCMRSCGVAAGGPLLGSASPLRAPDAPACCIQDI